MTNNEYETLHPDPAFRDWEYDGYGIKRYKDNFQKVVEDDMCPKCNRTIKPECRCEKG